MYAARSPVSMGALQIVPGLLCRVVSWVLVVGGRRPKRSAQRRSRLDVVPQAYRARRRFCLDGVPQGSRIRTIRTMLHLSQVTLSDTTPPQTWLPLFEPLVVYVNWNGFIEYQNGALPLAGDAEQYDPPPKKKEKKEKNSSFLVVPCFRCNLGRFHRRMSSQRTPRCWWTT